MSHPERPGISPIRLSWAVLTRECLQALQACRSNRGLRYQEAKELVDFVDQNIEAIVALQLPHEQ